MNDSNILLESDQICWYVEQHLVLDDISFTLNSGEFVGIIGPNGAGKTSLLKCLYKRLTPSSGSIKLLGTPINEINQRALSNDIAVVLQENTTEFDLQVIDILKMGLIPSKSILSVDNNDDERLIQQASKQVDIESYLYRNFNSLSGGEKQRVIIARAIIQKPKLLLMDEPTNHLDIHHQIEILKLVKSLGITVLMSLHDLNIAANFCNRLLLLNEGKLVIDGTPEEVLTEQRIIDIYKTPAIIDQHPSSDLPRITFNYQSE